MTKVIAFITAVVLMSFNEDGFSPFYWNGE